MSEIDDILGHGDSQEAFEDEGDAFDVFINGPRLGLKTFVNALTFWSGQLVNSVHNGLRRMALDVLSCPGMYHSVSACLPMILIGSLTQEHRSRLNGRLVGRVS
jgi:hypothetical protein